ncbi:hypothetical protein ACFLSS_00900 [Bacteroidota bacterium]
MKAILLLSIFLLLNSTSLAQRRDRPPHGVPEKILQLEKIKLIESLEMDEETTLKFFSRRTKHKKVVGNITEKEDSLIGQIESIIKGNQESSESELKQLIKELNSIQAEFHQTKTEFINSLNDLLSTEQIAKLIVFERRFRDELRGVLFRDRKFRKRY